MLEVHKTAHDFTVFKTFFLLQLVSKIIKFLSSDKLIIFYRQNFFDLLVFFVELTKKSKRLWFCVSQ